MKICLIGPGLMEIPPKGWGAVEIIIWDYYEILTKLGHEVYIINEKTKAKIIKKVNEIAPDFVHLHYDDYFDILSSIKCSKKAITSHYGYIKERFRKYDNNYKKIISGIVYNNFYIFCLSIEIYDIYRYYGVQKSRLILLPNGARDDLFSYYPYAENRKSVYLAKITNRKRQYLYQNIDDLLFIGNKDDNNFDYNSENYLGEWDKNKLYKNLSKYSNLVLLSDGEADPLVVKEALICGLGLVISQTAAANLDFNCSFIDIINNEKLDDIQYVSKVIKENRSKSLTQREEIRIYGLNTFSYSVISEKYIKIIENLKCLNSSVGLLIKIKRKLKWRI